MIRKSVLLVVGLLAPIVSPAGAQDRDTVLVLDASGSMWAQLPEGRARIEVARDVLSDYMATRDASVPMGVVAYGHNRRGDCSDIATVAPVAVQEGGALAARLRGLMPRGKTPLADALRRAATEIRPTAEEADIVLLTDGLETCGGDPCAVAAELAAQGIAIRAHVVGFGLTEGEVAQIACVAEATGGMVLAPQTGRELAEALIRTTEPVQRKAETAGAAALNLTIATEAAGMPDAVTFTARNMVTGEERPLGRLDFAKAQALPVDLAEGAWTLRADAGEQGQGETEITVQAGDSRTVYVPFTGLMPSLILDQLGPYRAGASGIFPARITREGLAVGGADFVLTLLPADATALTDRPVTWSMQEGSEGARVTRLNLPGEPGRYKIVFHRYGETDLTRALVTREIEVATRPEVQITAPAAVAPGAAVPVQVRGGGAHADRVEIWRDGALYSWDQSAYLEELFDNAYGPARVLAAPSEPGSYEVVYVFSDLDEAEAVAARLPLTVGVGALLEEAALAPASDPAPQPATQQADLAGGIGHRCDQALCTITDAQTGLSFALPQGWITDKPTLEASTTGGEPGLPRATFQRDAEKEAAIVLNPRQWANFNGPCQQVAMGQLCQFEGEGADPDVAALLARTLAWDDPTRQRAETATHGPDAHPLRGQAILSCEDDFGCIHQDDALQFFTLVPRGWSMTAPTRAAEPDKDGRAPLRLGFFSKMEMPDRIMLNPEGWSDADGPCLSVQAGMLCHSANGSAMLAPGLDMIRRTLRDSAPRRLPTPAEAMAKAVEELAKEDPAAGATLEALFGTAGRLDTTGGEAPDAGEMMGAVIGTLFNRAAPATLPPLDSTASSGVILHNCGPEGPCRFEQPDLAISGTLPPGWQVEVAVQRPDLRISTWFTHRDPAGNAKRLGLNQPLNDSCIETALGPLCHYTPYISTQEETLIARSLGHGKAGDGPAGLSTIGGNP